MDGCGWDLYTVSPSSAKIAQVVEVACSVCQQRIIGSAADAVTDNSLDNLTPATTSKLLALGSSSGFIGSHGGSSS